MTWINAIQTLILDSAPLIEERISIAKDVVIKAGVVPKNISVVLSTGMDVSIQPSDSVAIASGIGAEYALCSSVNNSCASISAAIDLAMHKIKGRTKEIAVVTSSSIFNEIYRDEKTVNYANGVGAVIISNNKKGLKVKKISHRKSTSFFGLKTVVAMDEKNFKFYERKKDELWSVYRQEAIDFPVEIMKNTLKDYGWDISEVDHWVFHSSELTELWATELGLNVKLNHPNMGALTSLVQLDELVVNGELLPRSKIAVLELALGMSVSVILLENEGVL